MITQNGPRNTTGHGYLIAYRESGGFWYGHQHLSESDFILAEVQSEISVARNNNVEVSVTGPSGEEVELVIRSKPALMGSGTYTYFAP